jgi:hypothetical protein
MDHDQPGGRDLFTLRLDVWAGQVAVHADLCTAASGWRATARPVCSLAMPMTMGNVAARRPHNQVIAHDLPGRLALAAHVHDREQDFCRSRRTPSTAGNEFAVTFRSTRTRITALSRMRQAAPSLAGLRRHQAFKTAPQFAASG